VLENVPKGFEQEFLASYFKSLDVLMAVSTSSLSNNILTIVNTKTLMSSIKSTMIRLLSILRVNIASNRSHINELVEKVLEPSVDPQRRAELFDEIKRRVIGIIVATHHVGTVVKHVEALMNINIPFHLQSDVVRNIKGYTST
jgi:hypothetical protein